MLVRMLVSGVRSSWLASAINRFCCSREPARRASIWLNVAVRVATSVVVRRPEEADAFNGTVVAVARVQPIVATLGMLVAGRGIALVITGGALIELFVPFFRTVRLGKLLGVPYVMWVAAILAVAAAVLVRRSAFGYRLLAIGAMAGFFALAAVLILSRVRAGFAARGPMLGATRAELGKDIAFIEGTGAAHE